MTTIPHFGASLLTNPPTAATISEEEKNNLISSPQLTQAPDSFEHEQPREQVPEKKSGGFGVWTFLGATAALTGLIVMGRKGMLGKYVQKFMGGKPSEKILSEATLKTKISEAIAPLEADGFKFAEIISKPGNKFATVERINAEGRRELIAFDKATGTPKRRVVFYKDDNGKFAGYKSYSEQDILAAGLADTGTPSKGVNVLDIVKADDPARIYYVTRNVAEGGEFYSRENVFNLHDKTLKYTRVSRSLEDESILYYDNIDGKVAGTHTLDEMGNITNQKWFDPNKRYLTDEEIFAKVEPKLSALGHEHIGFSAIKANGQNGYMERILPDGSRDVVTLDRVTGEPLKRIIVAPKGKNGEKAYQVYDMNDLKNPIKTLKDESYKKWFGLKGTWKKRTLNNNGAEKVREEQIAPNWFVAKFRKISNK